jgi:magnesium-transporting ATPase (P-type)
MVFLGALLIKKSPLTSMQMLWVCAINVMGALVFANGVPQRDVLLSRPHNRKDPIITPEMWRFVSIHSIFQIAILTLMLFKGDHLFSLPKE